jgi:hypothetical protein
MDNLGNIATGISQIAAGAAPLVGTGAQLYGQQNAAEAVEKANNAAITNQQTTLGNIGGIYSPYTTAGAGATGALSSALGLNGAAPDYSGFMNMPGYQFAVKQGTQALQRQAAAMGSAYTPQTAAAIGSYVAGTAMQDYNTYIQQLQNTATMGAGAANQLGNVTFNTGSNISQLQANTGQSQAGMYTGMGQTVGGALGSSPYASGVAGLGSGTSGVVSGIGNIAKGVGALFGNNYGGMSQGQLNQMMGGDVTPNTSGYIGAYTGANDVSNQPYYDQNADLYNSASGGNFDLSQPPDDWSSYFSDSGP